MANENMPRADTLYKDLYNKKITPERRKALHAYLAAELKPHFCTDVVCVILKGGAMPTDDQGQGILSDLQSLCSDVAFYNKWREYFGKPVKLKAKPAAKQVSAARGKMTKFMAKKP